MGIEHTHESGSVMNNAECSDCPPGEPQPEDCPHTDQCTITGIFSANGTFSTNDQARIVHVYRPRDNGCAGQVPSCPATAPVPDAFAILGTASSVGVRWRDVSIAETRYEVQWYCLCGQFNTPVTAPNAPLLLHTKNVAQWDEWRGYGYDSGVTTAQYTATQTDDYFACIKTVNKPFGSDDGLDGNAYYCSDVVHITV